MARYQTTSTPHSFGHILTCVDLRACVQDNDDDGKKDCQDSGAPRHLPLEKMRGLSSGCTWPDRRLLEGPPRRPAVQNAGEPK